MKTLKLFVKKFLSFIYNPLLYVQLASGGGRNLIIGRNIKIRNRKYLKVGSGVTICDNARFLFVDKTKGKVCNPQVKIGNNVFITYHFTLMAAAPIVIHDHVLIASHVMITSENHGIDPEYSDSYSSTPLDGKPVEIGAGCWLGERVIILPGVILGERCVVAAGAVVTKSFPSFTMLAGVPAKVIKKYSFTSHTWERVV